MLFGYIMLRLLLTLTQSDIINLCTDANEGDVIYFVYVFPSFILCPITNDILLDRVLWPCQWWRCNPLGGPSV